MRKRDFQNNELEVLCLARRSANGDNGKRPSAIELFAGRYEQVLVGMPYVLQFTHRFGSQAGVGASYGLAASGRRSHLWTGNREWPLRVDCRR